MNTSPLFHAAIGIEAGGAGESRARARQQQWSTMDRLSILWRGRQVLHDHGYDWSVWVTETLQGLTYRIEDMFVTPDPRHRNRSQRSELIEVA